LFCSVAALIAKSQFQARKMLRYAFLESRIAWTN